MADDNGKPAERVETSVRMEVSLARRVKSIAQVLGVSQNQVMVSAIQEMVMFYEGDPGFQEQHKAWLNEHSTLSG